MDTKLDVGKGVMQSCAIRSAQQNPVGDVRRGDGDDDVMMMPDTPSPHVTDRCCSLETGKHRSPRGD